MSLTLYQAEWCPFSSAVREVLTELGLDFVARQVEPWPSERTELREVAGTDQIPVLRTEDGRFFRGAREIFAHLHERDPWPFAAAHRRRFADHRDARESDVPGQLIEYVGLAAYRRRDGRISFTHTEVDESCEGRGFGSRLAAAALDDARRQGLRVLPLCPFVAHYVEQHPEYQELVRR